MKLKSTEELKIKWMHGPIFPETLVSYGSNTVTTMG